MGVSDIASKCYGPREIIMEALKCRIVCSHCHYFGRVCYIGDYYDQLAQQNVLNYSREIYGNEHRTTTEVMNLKEVASSEYDLEVRGAFSNGKDADNITYETIQVVVWMHLRIYLPDLRNRESRKKATSHNTMRTGTWCVKVFRELIKMLSIKDPHGVGEECFLNLTPTTRSGVEFNHMMPNKKLSSPGELLVASKNMNRFRKEARDGKLHAVSTGTHGMVTGYQKRKIKELTWYNGS